MKVFKDHIKTGSFKLKDLEHKFSIRRKVMKYKTSIFQIWGDWRNPKKKKAVLHYNREDVVNLVRLTFKIFKKYNVKSKYLDTIRLK
ncbi:MAG: ribonuclease H-like domain-containing protein [Chitinophagaceae bacterium]|nr:ribonuclease H-like domain-containing protein [Chitinophagaceae bacterium]